ncbi:hypothetical protein O6H91_Y197700 [Diphasiastrum complanatum]|nr:hypothetical protein O6H91_Y197700 [Diphasiastrum complanatum]
MEFRNLLYFIHYDHCEVYLVAVAHSYPINPAALFSICVQMALEPWGMFQSAIGRSLIW